MVIEAWEPPQAPTPVRKLSLATIERHRQIINKMEKDGFITKAQADAERKELREQL